MVDPKDWRLQGQERWLTGATLVKATYQVSRSDWDHDHCEFCSTKFSDRADDLNVGYVTFDSYHWVCENCFSDFREMFQWEVKGDV